MTDMAKKFFIRITNRDDGRTLFLSRSDNPKALIKRWKTEVTDPSSGYMYAAYYFGKLETNIDDRTWYTDE